MIFIYLIYRGVCFYYLMSETDRKDKSKKILKMYGFCMQTPFNKNKILTFAAGNLKKSS